MRILLVDDSEVDTLLTRAVLNRVGLGTHIDTADRAEAALQRLADPGTPPVDLILLDLNMPGMNGFEFIEALGQLKPIAHDSAIVVLSNSPMPEDRSRALSYPSVSDYLIKPLTLDAATHLNRYAADATKSEQTPTGS